MTTHQISDGIILIANFMPKEECEAFIAQSKAIGYEKAKINTLGGQQLNLGVRNNNRAFLNDEELAAQLYQRAKDGIPPTWLTWEAIGLNELFRFYEYEPGQRFKAHRDGSYIRNENEVSFYTFMVYLNDDFEGGETTFANHVITPVQGYALIFLHQLFHEGETVTEGLKYVLRTDVMYRRGG